MRNRLTPDFEQSKDIYLIRECAKKSGVTLSNFITNHALELYFDIQKDGRDLCYIYKGWHDPGFRISELIEFKNRYTYVSFMCEIYVMQTDFGIKSFKDKILLLEDLMNVLTRYKK